MFVLKPFKAVILRGLQWFTGYS